jgi:hypothetical protein
MKFCFIAFALDVGKIEGDGKSCDTKDLKFWDHKSNIPKFNGRVSVYFSLYNKSEMYNVHDMKSICSVRLKF